MTIDSNKDDANVIQFSRCSACIVFLSPSALKSCPLQILKTRHYKHTDHMDMPGLIKNNLNLHLQLCPVVHPILMISWWQSLDLRGLESKFLMQQEHLLLYFLKREEGGNDVAVATWGKMQLGGCAAVMEVGGLGEDIGRIAGGMEHHWDRKMDWKGAGQEELLVQPSCIGGAEFYVVLDTAGCLCMALTYEQCYCLLM